MTPTAPLTSPWFSTRMARNAYIVAPNGLKVGDKVVSGASADIVAGNALPLVNIPLVPSSTTWSCTLAKAPSWLEPLASRPS